MEPWEIGYDDADREETETGECVEDLDWIFGESSIP
jgi:hypothetical protein